MRVHHGFLVDVKHRVGDMLLCLLLLLFLFLFFSRVSSFCLSCSLLVWLKTLIVVLIVVLIVITGGLMM